MATVATTDRCRGFIRLLSAFLGLIGLLALIPAGPVLAQKEGKAMATPPAGGASEHSARTAPELGSGTIDP
ncbi:MAG: hypothetical protein HOP29_13735, partial [Phycisphaerales bacterium]|nr:hypothetical protein [Phycisphaerales bacterium]